jgi:predicted adenine nucleotide alpha hydrolase (AANH) superfamily ATPase
MDGIEEYHKRSSELQRLCDEFGVDCIIENYDSNEFYSAVKGLEEEKEGGKRCSVCYALRLKKATEYAKQNGYEYITTTLTISPLKDAQRLNEIGNSLSQNIGVKFLPSDFKKKGGYLRSIELSKEFGLYRQNYCGCEFSKHFSPNEI